MYSKLFLFILVCLVGGTVNVKDNFDYASKNPTRAIFVMATVNDLTVDNTHIEKSTPYAIVDINYPTIQGLNDKKFQRLVNQFLKFEATKDMYATLKEGKQHYKSQPLSTEPFECIRNFSLVESVSDFLVLERFRHIKKSTFSYSTEKYYLTIDLENNRIITLSDLFSKSQNYTTLIKEAISVEKGNSVDDIIIDDKTNFYVNSKGNLVIIFNEPELEVYELSSIKLSI